MEELNIHLLLKSQVDDHISCEAWNDHSTTLLCVDQNQVALMSQRPKVEQVVEEGQYHNVYYEDA
jgi:hypothetical protein